MRSRSSIRLAGLLGVVTTLALLVLAFERPAHALEHLKVSVPDKDNLQYLTFWFAKAGACFEREGLELEVVSPSDPKNANAVDAMIEKGEVDAAVLPPTAYLPMVARKAPIVIVANLFANDPYGLLVRRDVAEARKVTADTPIHDRLSGLRGAKVGVPPAAFGRLRELFATQGLDSAKDLEPVVLLARDHKTALEDKRVDALYIASPLLEKGAVDADSLVLFAQARGEVPALASRQTNVLAVSRHMMEQRRDVVTSAVRAILEAETRIHAAQGEVVDALAREFPARDRREIEAAVRLYAPAVPRTPDVRAEDLTPTTKLFPESVPKPELSGVSLADFVAPEIARDAASSHGQTRGRWLAILLVSLISILLVVWIRRRRLRMS